MSETVSTPTPRRGGRRKDAAIIARKKRAATAIASARKRANAAASELKAAEKLNAAANGFKTTIAEAEALAEAPQIIKDEFAGREVIFKPNEGPQTEFLAATEKEVFYGGARGGGKSYSLIVDPLRDCDKEAHRALIIRRTMPELRDLIANSQRLYDKAYPGAKFSTQTGIWKFPSGARIEFKSAETSADALQFQGQSYSWIGVDELPQYSTPDLWNSLRGSLRSTDTRIKPYMRATGNPGNIGSAWVKDTFINPAPWGQAFNVEVEIEGKKEYFSRRFIPAKLSDNPYLTKTNDYLIMLASLPEVQRKQWLEGDWDAFEGAAFPEFNRNIHVVEPYAVPSSWFRFRACDWGYGSAACCLWFAVDYDGNLVIYRELYTTKVLADKFARMVVDLERKERVNYGVMDSSTWAKRGDPGPTIAETMIREGCKWRPSDRSPGSRIPGKQQVHKRLKLNEFTLKPGITIFNTCTNLIADLPVLPTDPHDPEDVDTKARDHSYDALRYGVMSRPISAGMMAEAFTNTIRNIQTRRPADSILGY